MSEKPSILMADDEPSIRRIFTEVVEFSFPQIEVVTARDGIDCIEKLRARRFDLLFLNIVMPRATGLAVLDFLKKSGSTMPVWVMSGSYTGPESDEKVRGLGARGIIPKPPSIDDILGVVEKELGLRAAVV